ncbi:hypothetical protein [Streptomyces sp. AS02]|uniref:hypothetical protein n=1 Tax=Streptomyces sp. AS02 TaxID=2938946 RepID=UPI002021CF3C|nr:hypothetical protein [Streptomyces sp. AS02]MCL8016931.1 hypothetical protein [Streptomyces sp. AS02]
MGQDTAAAAASALRLLNSPDLRHQPATAPTGRHSTPTTAGTPLNLAILDYLTEHVNQVVTHTRELAGDVPAPAGLEDLYHWYINETSNAPADQQAVRDTLIETHRLEHLVRLGEADEVCKHPCPKCGCWGLMWDHGGNRARCSNRRCRTPDGMTSSWTLARLAAQKIQRTEIWRRNAT